MERNGLNEKKELEIISDSYDLRDNGESDLDLSVLADSGTRSVIGKVGGGAAGALGGSALCTGLGFALLGPVGGVLGTIIGTTAGALVGSDIGSDLAHGVNKNIEDRERRD